MTYISVFSVLIAVNIFAAFQSNMTCRCKHTTNDKLSLQDAALCEVGVRLLSTARFWRRYHGRKTFVYGCCCALIVRAI